MAIAQKGTWWRTSRGGAATEALVAAVIGPNRTIFVGQDAGSPRIYTAPTAQMKDDAPTYTQRTPAGSAPLFGVDYAADIDEAVAVGDSGTIETSVNQGLDWTSQTVSLSPPLYDVVAASGAAARFAVAAFNSIWVRDAGGVWTKNWSGGQAWYGVTRKGIGGWVVVGQNGYATQSATALSGSFIAKYQITTTTLNRVRANGFWFMAVGQQGKVFRSVTGVSGSWADVSIPESADLLTLSPLDSANRWVVFDSLGYSWYTPDNGSNWAKKPTPTAYPAGVLDNGADFAVAGGSVGSVYVSYDQAQEDFISTAAAETPPPAFNANDDMAGDAVRRLVTQFRSGRG